MLQRSVAAVRLAVLAGVVVAVVGIAGYLAGGSPVGGVWLTASLGPTAYVLLIHPDDVESRVPTAALAHAIAIGAGLGALAVFGLWDAPSVAETHREALPQVGAQAAAIAVTVLLVVLAGAGHAPAAATTLLVASGIAAPGKPLIGLALGLVIVLVLAPVLTRLAPRGRRPSRRDASADRPRVPGRRSAGRAPTGRRSGPRSRGPSTG